MVGEQCNFSYKSLSETPIPPSGKRMRKGREGLITYIYIDFMFQLAYYTDVIRVVKHSFYFTKGKSNTIQKGLWNGTHKEERQRWGGWGRPVQSRRRWPCMAELKNANITWDVARKTAERWGEGEWSSTYVPKGTKRIKSDSQQCFFPTNICGERIIVWWCQPLRTSA